MYRLFCQGRHEVVISIDWNVSVILHITSLVPTKKPNPWDEGNCLKHICMNSLAVQFLEFFAFTAKVIGLIPGQRTKIPQDIWLGKKQTNKWSIFNFSRDTDKTRSKENHKLLNSLSLWAHTGLAKEFVWVSYKIVGNVQTNFLAKPKFYINFTSVKVARNINRHITHIIKSHLHILQYIRTR